MRRFSDPPCEMQHRIKASIFTALLLSISGVPSAANAKSSARPVEVKSDPHGVGNPTRYSILRGDTRVTFSHPLLGQFTRVEVLTRQSTGNLLTRFVLDSHRRTYQPVLHFLTPFETHFSKSEETFCATKPSSMEVMISIAPKTIDSEILAKKREELQKTGFFDKSCFNEQIPIDHRNAIMNAAADVLSTSTQDVLPATKYLRCMEKYGFAHEAGIVQALDKKSSKDSKANCKLRLGCTSDDEAETGRFDEKSCLITMKTTPEPDRDDYGREIFHEILHSVPIRDGTPLALLEECCTAGKKCDALRVYAEKTKVGEKIVTLSETANINNSVLSSTAAILKGSVEESMAFTATTKPAKNQNLLITANPTTACKDLGKQICANESLNIFEQQNRIITFCPVTMPENSDKATSRSNLFLSTLLAKALAEEKPKTCPTRVNGAMTIAAVATLEGEKKEAKVYADLVEKLPQTSPVSFDEPMNNSGSVPVRLADSENESPRGTSIGNTPTRTIASIEPLPEPRVGQQLGSPKNRAMSDSRASFLVDTLESAAKKVSKTLTPAKLELLEVDRKKIFETDFKAKTKSPHYLVTSSATKPIQVADIGDIQNLSFPNPFADVKVDTSDTQTRKQKNDEPPKKIATAGDGKSAGKPKDAAIVSRNAFASNQDPNLAGSSVSSRSPSGAGQQITNSSASRTTASSSKTNYKEMDKSTLLKFITSSFRTVSTELENKEFLEALVANGIQIHDHENRRLGSVKPDETFIYDPEKGRLVQTRANREKK